MDIIFIVLLLCVFFAEVGTWLRMCIQYRRDGVWPGGEEWELSTVVETFIAGCIGLIVWMVYLITDIPEGWIQAVLYLTAASTGYAGADAIEGLLKRYEPNPDG